MKTRNFLVSVKCIILCLIVFMFSCATNKQNNFSSDLLGTWFFGFEDNKGLYFEQAFTFNADGSGTVETRQYSNFVWGGQTSRVLLPEHIKKNNILPTSERSKIYIIDNGRNIQVSYRINDNYLVIFGITNNIVDQTNVRYRKLSETEVQKWLEADGELK